jgi:hypothetical protein
MVVELDQGEGEQNRVLSESDSAATVRQLIVE